MAIKKKEIKLVLSSASLAEKEVNPIFKTPVGCLYRTRQRKVRPYAPADFKKAYFIPNL